MLFQSEAKKSSWSLCLIICIGLKNLMDACVLELNTIVLPVGTVKTALQVLLFTPVH